MLTIYRRHKPTCAHFTEGRGFHHCKCPVWANGVLGGREVRKSLKTRDWTKANREVQKWEATERVYEHGAPKLIADAWTSFIADLEARQLSHGTIRKYKALRLRMETFGTTNRLSFVADFSLDVLSRFRATWKDSPKTSAKKLDRLRSFFGFCLSRKWVEENPAKNIKQPKITLNPTMPLTNDEWKKLLDAADTRITTIQSEGKLGALRLKSLIILMRYSGLRISDAVGLTAERLDGNKLFLYTQKTGTAVYTVLPNSVLLDLEETPRVTDTRFFWSGNGKRETAVCDFQEKLKNLFKDAGIK